MSDAVDLFRELFEHSPEPSGIVCPLGLFIAVNQAWEQMMRWPRDAALGKSTEELGLWPDLEVRSQVLADLSETGVVKQKLALRRRDGELVRVLCSIRRIVRPEGPFVLFTSHDLTAVEALELSQARLRALGEATFEGLGMTRDGKVADCNEQLASMLGSQTMPSW